MVGRGSQGVTNCRNLTQGLEPDGISGELCSSVRICLEPNVVKRQSSSEWDRMEPSDTVLKTMAPGQTWPVKLPWAELAARPPQPPPCGVWESPQVPWLRSCQGTWQSLVAVLGQPVFFLLLFSQSWTKQRVSLPLLLCGFPQAQQERPVGWEGKRETNRRKSRMREEKDKEMRERRKNGEEPRTEGSVQGTGIVKWARYDITLSSEPLCKNQWELAILLISIYPKEMKSYVDVKTSVWMFIGALFTTAKNWQQLYPSTDEWINKLIFLQWNSCTVIKKNKLNKTT